MHMEHVPTEIVILQLQKKCIQNLTEGLAGRALYRKSEGSLVTLVSELVLNSHKMINDAIKFRSVPLLSITSVSYSIFVR